MGTCGFSMAGVRRIMAAACLLVLGIAVVGCAALNAALHTSLALQDAGYQNVNVNVSNGDGAPAGGLVSVVYSRGPSGSDQGDAQRAEKIVWDTYSDRFGAVAIIKESGGCAGPFCATHSDELASATYAQLAARFGPRPRGLDKGGTGGSIKIPGWAIPVGLGLVVVIIGTVATAATLILRRKGRNRRPGVGPWPSGPSGPSGPPAEGPWPPAPPGAEPWPPAPPGPGPWPPAPPGA